MQYLNKCTFAGRLLRNPEKRRSERNGVTRTTFSIELLKPYKDETGESKMIVQWIRCVACSTLGDKAYDELTLGDEIIVEGELRTGKITKEGIKQINVEIYLNEFKRLKQNEGIGQNVQIANGRQKQHSSHF